MKKRVVALVLALALAMGLTSGLVFAADDDTLEVDGGEINAGEVITYDFDEDTILTLSFTPSESGTYKVSAGGNSEIAIEVTTEETFSTEFYSFTWSAYSAGADIYAYFEAGITYYIQVVFWGGYYDVLETYVSAEACEIDWDSFSFYIYEENEYGEYDEFGGLEFTEGTSYTVTGGSQIVTISESYIESLDADKTYELYADYNDYFGIVQILTIGNTEADSSSEADDSDADDSDDSDSTGTGTSSDDGSDDTSSDTDAEEASASLSIIDSETTASYTLGSGTAAVIAVDADINTFVSVTVDGTVLTQNTDYTVTEGSTIITFTESFLETLSEGEHDVVIAFEGGDVETTLSIAAASEDASDSDDSDDSSAAEVGDSSGLALWMALGLFAALSLAGAGLRRKFN